MSTSTPIPLPDSAPYTPLPRSERPIILPLLLTLALFALTTYLTLSPPSLTPLTRLRNRLSRRLSHFLSLLPSLPPSLAALSLAPPSDLATAIASFEGYYAHQTAVLNAKHRAFYAQPAAHRRVAGRLGWIGKLRKVEECVEGNGEVVGLLGGLGRRRAGEWGVPVGLRSRWERKDARVVEVSG